MSEQAFVAVVAGLAGLAIGSFLNVVIARVPKRQSVVQPRSHCPSCDAPIAGRDNVPVVSWLVLGRKCRSCSAPISWRYPMVELVTAGLFVAMAFRFGPDAVVAAFCLFMAFLLAVTVVDLEHFIVPNRIVYPTLGLSVILLAVAAAADHHWNLLARSAIGGAIGFVALGVIHVIQPRGMGFGDVRMAGIIGIYLGWLGLPQLAVGLFLAFLLAGVIGVGLVVFGGRGAKTRVPFAPFLAAGALLTVVWGRPMAHLWLG